MGADQEGKRSSKRRTLSLDDSEDRRFRSSSPFRCSQTVERDVAGVSLRDENMAFSNQARSGTGSLAVSWIFIRLRLSRGIKKE